MSNPVDVCWYTNAMAGAPALAGQAGKMPDVLDACLLTGFGSKTLSSLVVASGVATGTVSTGHEFLDYVVVLVAGATLSGLNGKKRITVVNSTTFTFDATGISDQTATGTITVKMAPPGGWEKKWSGTNKAAYRSTAIGATGHLLRVDDSPALYPTLIVYEDMPTDVDTGTGPSIGNQWFCKSTQADSTAVNWRLFADDRAFCFLVANVVGDALYYGAMYFGDIVPALTNDAYHSLLIGHYSNAHPLHTNFIGIGNNYRNGSIARSHDQEGSAIVTTRISHYIVGGTIGNYLSSAAAPTSQPQDNFLCAPVEVWTHNESIFRGLMPGLYSPLHKGTDLVNGTIQTSMQGGGITSRSMFITRIANNAVAIDITGPWR